MADAWTLCDRCGEACAADAPGGVCSECRDVYEPLLTGILRGQTVTLCAVVSEPGRWLAWSRERPGDPVQEGDTPERALVAFFDACAKREARP